MIHDIRSATLRRVVLVATVAAIVVCLGPLHLIKRVCRWIEDEFDVDLRETWHGVYSTTTQRNDT